MNQEIWKTCLTTDRDIYEISNLGNCRRKFRSQEGYNILNCSIKNTGYKYIKVIINSKRQNKYIHQLVAKSFLGERPEGLVIDHINRNKLDNNLENLRYVTIRENVLNSDRCDEII
jgi:hypothetical protein